MSVITEREGGGGLINCDVLDNAIIHGDGI